MDAVYAWDQPDLHFHVPRGDDHSCDQIIFQASLEGEGICWRSDGLTADGWRGHEAENAGGGVGGGMTALAQQVL